MTTSGSAQLTLRLTHPVTSLATWKITATSLANVHESVTHWLKNLYFTTLFNDLFFMLVVRSSWDISSFLLRTISFTLYVFYFQVTISVNRNSLIHFVNRVLVDPLKYLKESSRPPFPTSTEWFWDSLMGENGTRPNPSH